jgi:GDP-L-fucose synthase
MKKNSKIYIAGHTGLVGSAILRRLKSEGFTNLIYRTHAELDLTRQADVDAFFAQEQPEYVFLAAAKVGGIWANNTYPADFIYSNLAIQTNVLNAAWKTGVKRLLFLGSSCIYPRECPQPMKEEYLLTGPLEPTNQPYAVAKIAGVIACEAYNRQYKTRFLAVMPSNLYGPNDNYNLENSHVLPAMVRKFHLAKLATQGDWDGIKKDESRYGSVPDDFVACLASISKSHGHDPVLLTPYSSLLTPSVMLWGTGSPRREFLHVDDLADAALFLMNLPDTQYDALLFGENDSHSTIHHSPFTSHYLPLINIGSGHDQTVRELANPVAEVVGYKGDVIWDDTKPDGTPRKLLDVSKLANLGWKPKIPLKQGIKTTYKSYLKQLK